MTANMGSRRAAQNDMIINDDLDTFTFTLPKPTPEFQQANRKAEDYWKKFHTKMTAATSSGPKAAAQPAVSPQVQAVVRPQAAPPSPKPPVASFSHFAPVGRAEPAQAAIAPVVRKDEDGDVLMEDIEDPVTIQSVSDAVMLSRYTQKGKKEESVSLPPMILGKISPKLTSLCRFELNLAAELLTHPASLSWIRPLFSLIRSWLLLLRRSITSTRLLSSSLGPQSRSWMEFQRATVQIWIFQIRHRSVEASIPQRSPRTLFQVSLVRLSSLCTSVSRSTILLSGVNEKKNVLRIWLAMMLSWIVQGTHAVPSFLFSIR